MAKDLSSRDCKHLKYMILHLCSTVYKEKPDQTIILSRNLTLSLFLLNYFYFNRLHLSYFSM